jgi:uncharacterized linocin/CFP29 family protein
MNGSLGRDKVWNDHIWGEIDKAVRDEVGRNRVAQKVFPSTITNNVLPVVANVIAAPPPGVPPVLRTGDDEFLPFIELSIEFVLTQAQVDGEENMRLAPILARRAASAVAAAEDALLFLGVAPAGVTVTNRGAIHHGFIREAAGFPAVMVKKLKPGFVGDIIGAVANGIADLNRRDQHGPYALFLPPIRYAETFSPQTRGVLQTPGDSIKQIVTGGFCMVNSLNDNVGVLASLGGEPAQIILGTDATAAFTSTHSQGDYHFRVFERVQLMVRDRRAFQTLEFPAPA